MIAAAMALVAASMALRQVARSPYEPVNLTASIISLFAAGVALWAVAAFYFQWWPF